MPEFAIEKLSDLQRAGDPSLAILEIDTKDIKCLRQVRDQRGTGFKGASIEELAKSMSHEGQLEPAIVRPNQDANGPRYIMVAGERRLKAAEQAGLKLKAVVRDVTEEEARRIQLAENIHREILSQLEIARAVKDDLARLGTLTEVAQAWDKSVQWVSQQAKFLEVAQGQGPAAEAIKENVTSDREAITNLGKLQEINLDTAQEVLSKLKTDQKAGKKTNVRETVGKALKDEKGKLPPRKAADGETKADEDMGYDPKFQIEAYCRWLKEGLQAKSLKRGEFILTAPLESLYGDHIQVTVKYDKGQFTLSDGGLLAKSFPGQDEQKFRHQGAMGKVLAPYKLQCGDEATICARPEEFPAAAHKFMMGMWLVTMMGQLE